MKLLSLLGAAIPSFRTARAFAADAAGQIPQFALAADLLRPQFHLLPKRNWMNDPNGPIYWNGNYHMFFQYNPNAAVWGDMHWNHAVSPDMIHWKHLPVALGPTTGGYDTDGCFSGSGVIHRGTAHFLYTGVQSVPAAQATLRDGAHNFREVVALATSRDPQLLKLEKFPEPVILPPDEPRIAGFRDPFLWQQDQVWYLGIGSGLYGEGGRVLLYRSSDLQHWEALDHPLASGKRTDAQASNRVAAGEMWECPDFFALGDKHLLFYSTAGKVFWESGEFDSKELVFHAQKRGVLDHGNYYAPKSQLAPDNRRILWGWIPETRPEAEFSAAGWSGSMSLPRVLSIDNDGNLVIDFAEETESLRGALWSLPGPDNPAARRDALRNFQLDRPSAELALRFGSEPFELRLGTDDATIFSIAYHPQNSGKELEIAGHVVPLAPRTAGGHELRLFLDASVLEAIVNRSIAVTARVYRTWNAPMRLRITESFDSSLGSVSALDCWTINPISSDRLTT